MDATEPQPETGEAIAGTDLDETVARLLGRRPQGEYRVVVSRADGSPVVLANAPFLHSGRPMPTRYWLIDPDLNSAIGRLESIGGVKAAEASVEPAALAQAHDRYRSERERLIPDDHVGPRPSGGVGGTRQGVKCLHAHYAYHLAGGDDPVGRWVHERLDEYGDLVAGLVPAEAPAEDDATVERGHRAGHIADDSASGPTVVVHIGHESTEMATRLADGSISAMTLPIGASTVAAQYLQSDPPDPAELSAALSVIELHLDDVIRERPRLAEAVAASEVVGLGVVRFVAEVELGVADGDEIDGYRLERSAAEELFRALATEPHADRAANPGLAPDHVGWIVGAMCILLEFMRRFGVEIVRVSTLGRADWLRGPDGAGTNPPPVDPDSGR